MFFSSPASNRDGTVPFASSLTSAWYTASWPRCVRRICILAGFASCSFFLLLFCAAQPHVSFFLSFAGRHSFDFAALPIRDCSDSFVVGILPLLTQIWPTLCCASMYLLQQDIHTLTSTEFHHSSPFNLKFHVLLQPRTP